MSTDKETTTFGFSPKRMAKLLGIGVEDDGQSNEAVTEAKAELLRARFAGPLPLETAVVDVLPTLMGKLCQELLPLGGRPLGEVLLDEETGLDVLEKIKAYGKKLARQDEPERSVGITVYYTAIASALLFHDKKITGHSYRYLRDSFDAIDKDWMPGNLARHITKAQRICGKRAKN
ncbi:MAG: hypothetical protein KAV00_01395 [Phycisphaerae bacterium]|nr:hypothetical protein [Phycisphaerae bacterium]